ncbi:MAG: Gfo/Idh/MocA family oxidoreductase [Candidatus Hydrogenedentes bacterium]|nr:Gfo/Idh/MocA family oxidoreductase [Candidatus Hydrogenedentota bacterium]
MIKIAAVGCGGIQNEHYRHLSAIHDVKLVGHCDIDRARAEDAANQYGGDAFIDYEAMYDKVKPHAVYISVPPFAHSGMEEAAAARSIHLFIEKPIGWDCTAAKRIGAAIKRADIITSVGYCWRYYDTVAKAREVLRGKAVSLIRGAWNGDMPGVWWWRRMDKSGGQVNEQTTHIFDLARYLCGDVAEVYAAGATGCQTHVENYTVHDSSVVTLRMKSGAAGVITSSCVASHHGDVGLEIVTPEATVSIRFGKLTVHEDGTVTEYSPKVNIYGEEDRAFIEAVRTGKRTKIKSSFADAQKTFAVTCAANESMRSGLPVKP